MTHGQRRGRPALLRVRGDAAFDLDLSSAAVARQMAKRMLSPDFEDWSEAVARVGSCLHPIHSRVLHPLGHRDRGGAVFLLLGL